MPNQYSLDISQISFCIHLIGGFCLKTILQRGSCSETDSVEPLSQQVNLKDNLLSALSL